MNITVISAVCAAVMLSGCGTTALNDIAKNTACTTRVSGKVAFGSITPTGTFNWSAVCKPNAAAPTLAEVPIPPAPEDAAPAPK